MLNFSHTYLYFKNHKRTYFCGIYVYFMGFFRRQKAKSFNPLKLSPGCLPVDRTVDRGRRRSTGPVDRCAQTCTSQMAERPIDRVGRPPESICSLKMALVDRSVDRQRVLLSVSSSGRSSGRSFRESLLSGSRPARPGGQLANDQKI